MDVILSNLSGQWNFSDGNSTILTEDYYFYDNETNYTPRYKLQKWENIVWCIVFGILVTIAVLGNVIVMWIVLGNFF